MTKRDELLLDGLEPTGFRSGNYMSHNEAYVL